MTEWDVPMESVAKQVRAHLREGMTPEDAAEAVLAPYGATPLPEWAREGLVREARGIHRALNRRVEDRAFSPRATLDDRAKVARTDFSLPDGRRLHWEECTLVELQIKAAWLRVQLDALHTDLVRIERAIGLLEGLPPGTRLGDVDGWQDVVSDRDDCERSGDPDDPGDLSQAA